MKHPKRFLMGAAVIVFCFIITGNFAILFLTIICTGGISLLAYIPLAYAIGTVLDKLIFKGKLKKSEIDQTEKIIEKNNTTTHLTNNQVALVNYIREARASGMGDGQIAGVLKDNGWLDEDIKNSFKIA